ncbi:MAG TPA: MFS transporter, partial [Candidatus Binataceae bacterium]
SWLVLKLTNSSMMLGVVSCAQVTPILLVGLFAGVVVDRIDRRRMLIGTQTLLMLSAFTLAALTFTGLVRVEHVIFLAAFNGTVGSFDMPGRQSFVVEMVGYDDLANAIALNSMMFNGARMLGPAAAGLLIAWFGTGTCFFINGLSFLAVIWSLWQMNIAPRAIDVGGARVFAQLREGLAYVWRHRAIFWQMALAAVTNGFGYQYLVLVPIFARNVLHSDARAYGFLVAIQGLGSVFGAATLASRVTTRGIRNNLIAGLFISAAGIVTFGMSPWLSLSLIAQLVIGAGLTNFRASNNTLVQLFVSDELRGRVMSTYQLASVGMMPLGALTVGFMGRTLGPQHTVVICGAVTIMSGIVLVTWLKSVGSPEPSMTT